MPDGFAFERIVLSPDGKRIAAASDSSKVPMVGVWEVATGRLTHRIASKPLGDDAVVALAFSSDGAISPDGRRCAGGAALGPVRP